ncbi:hypothetical protein [Salinibaculum salinum]|uniref:hypothetical protein n=1 Tax=Salinibaculum salinum TaxID=3131996 RepID=UPI0030ED7857
MSTDARIKARIALGEPQHWGYSAISVVFSMDYGAGPGQDREYTLVSVENHSDFVDLSDSSFVAALNPENVEGETDFSVYSQYA